MDTRTTNCIDPDNEQMLEMFDFSWFPVLALSLNPPGGDPTMEQQICESYGHPNYFELPEIPSALIEKIFENGAVDDTDDPKNWYKRYYDWNYVKDLWYDLGCRDRAFALHRAGYPTLAEEHAEQYGTGYYDDLLVFYCIYQLCSSLLFLVEFRLILYLLFLF